MINFFYPWFRVCGTRSGSRPAARDLDICRLQSTSMRLPHPNRAGKLLNRLARKGVYSFCITLMCCRRTAVAGSRNMSARSASSR
jgi:hypothetical protein